MSEKLSERMWKSIPPLRWGKYEQFRRWADEIAALEQQLAAKDAEIARLRKEIAEAFNEDTYVAWVFYRGGRDGNRPATIHLCDSDAPGAFKVWRRKGNATLAETPEVPEVLGKCDYSHGYRSVPGFRLHAKKNDCINWRAETHAAPSANRPVMATRNAVTTIDAHDDKSEIWHVTDGDEQQKWHCYEVSPGRWMCDLMETAPAAPEVK